MGCSLTLILDMASFLNSLIQYLMFTNIQETFYQLDELKTMYALVSYFGVICS